MATGPESKGINNNQYEKLLHKILSQNEENISNFESIKKSYELLDRVLKRNSHDGIDINIFKLLNLIQFATLCSDDLNIATYEVSNPKLYSLKWEKFKRFHTKILALMIFEMLDDFIRLLPNPMYKILEDIDPSGNYINDAKGLHKELVEIKKDDYEYLRGIRNNIAAHKEKDASMQIVIINGIDTVKIIKISDRLKLWLNKVSAILAPVLRDLHNKIIVDAKLKLNKI